MIRPGSSFDNEWLLDVVTVPSSTLDSLLARALSWIDSSEDLIPWLSLLLSVPLFEGVDELSFPPRRALARTPLRPRPEGGGDTSGAAVSMKRRLKGSSKVRVVEGNVRHVCIEARSGNDTNYGMS